MTIAGGAEKGYLVSNLGREGIRFFAAVSGYVIGSHAHWPF